MAELRRLRLLRLLLLEGKHVKCAPRSIACFDWHHNQRLQLQHNTTLYKLAAYKLYRAIHKKTCARRKRLKPFQ